MQEGNAGIICLLRLPGKVYGRVIERLISNTEGHWGDEHHGYRKETGCKDQIFVFRTISEVPTEGKDVKAQVKLGVENNRRETF